jgi:rare lipoprotein A
MRSVILISALLLALPLAGCSSKKEALNPFAGIGSPHFKGSGPIPKGGGRYHVGKPYQVAGRWYRPKEQPKYDKTGSASWYGDAFHRRKTSNGEYFDMNEMTAAHPTLPLPSYAKVTNVENGREIIVRINDRGPFVGTRLIDLSRRSATALGFINQGKANVRVQWLGAAPINDNGSHLAAMNKALLKGAEVAELRAKTRGSNGSERIGSSQMASNDLSSPASETRPSYTIQVGTFRNQANALAAMSMVDEIATANIRSSETADGIYYTTAIGPILNQVEAAQILEQVQASGFHDAELLSSAGQVAALQ